MAGPSGGVKTGPAMAAVPCRLHTPPMARTLFDELGGEAKLRAIIDEFVDRVFDDVMIGFFFRRARRERIKRFEYQHAAELLGALGVRYEGRPLAVAHGPHPILGGHFERRKQILREVLERHGAPEHVVEAWLAHVESLRPLITSDAGSECNHDAALESTRGDGSP